MSCNPVKTIFLKPSEATGNDFSTSNFQKFLWDSMFPDPLEERAYHANVHRPKKNLVAYSEILFAKSWIRHCTSS